MTRGRHPVNYRDLAIYLSKLGKRSTCADMVLALANYPDCEAGLQDRLVAAVTALPPEKDWLFDGVWAIGDTLGQQNVRFDSGLFADWIADLIWPDPGCTLDEWLERR